MPDISIIIPTLNEAASLPATLAAIQSCDFAPQAEVIIVDAHSDDATAVIARESGARIASTERRQRAHQLNLGAETASGEIFLFLHADTHLPIDGLHQIMETMKEPEVSGGAFIRQFNSPSTLLKITCRLAAWRNRRLGIFLGDQGIFIRRSVFNSLRGFDENRAICEDLDLSRRLRKLGKVVTLSGPLISSARRFERRGPFRQTLVDLWLTGSYFLGR